MEFRLNQYMGNENLIFKIESKADTLKLTYVLPDINGLVWPDYSGILRANKLWSSTCFELFLGSMTQSGYIELNVTPAGDWNCYLFDRYRQGMRRGDAWELINVETHENIFTSIFSGRLKNNHIRIGPAAILQRKSSELSYFALSHPEQPDFHDSARHVLVSTDEL